MDDSPKCTETRKRQDNIGLTTSNAEDWNGSDDPDDPRTFSLGRRLYSIVSVTFLAFVSTFAAAIYSPGASFVAEEFKVSEELAILPLSFYNIGMALGPLVSSPLCENFGRRVVFLTTSPIFALFMLGAGFSQSLLALIICRFFAGFFAAPAIGNASATIIDYTAGQYRAVTMAFYYSVPTFGALFAPLVGGLVVVAKGWRWTQWTAVFFTVAFYIPVCFTKESYKKLILQRRAKRLGIEGPLHEARSAVQFVKYFAMTQLGRPLHMLLTEPIVALVCTYNAFLFGLIYTFVVASSWVYETSYGFDLTSQSLSYLGLDIGAVTAPILLIILDFSYYQPRLRRFEQVHGSDHTFPPENRLFPALIASFLLPLALFGYAWTARPDIHWAVPMIFQGIATTASTSIYAPTNLFMMDHYGSLYGASAAGAAMLSRYILSAAFPLFSLQLYERLGVGWATSLLAFCTLAMAPIPWLFWKRGERIRGKTKYETSN